MSTSTLHHIHIGELKNYYLRLIITNGEPIKQDERVSYAFEWPPSGTGAFNVHNLQQGQSFFISHETEDTKMPEPIPVVFTKSVVSSTGGGSASTQTLFLNYTTSPSTNQTMILGGGGGAAGGSSGGGNSGGNQNGS